MNTLTVMFSHFNIDHVNFLYNWQKDKVSNLKIVWNVNGKEKEEIEKNDNEHIIPMDLPMLRSKNFTQISPSCLNWFKDKKYDYYILMESDSVILDDEFEPMSIEYMQKNQISLMMPWIRTPALNEKHIFAENLKLVESKMWAIPAISIITVQGLYYYGYAGFHAPDFWHEIRFPTVLNQGGYFVSFNPFVEIKSFTAPKDRILSLTKEQIREGIIEDNVKALHPIKEIELFDYIKELLNERKNRKAK
jgi:hypothetical protein